MLKGIAIRVLLICVSCSVALVAAELGLRRFFPRYEYAAGSTYDADSMRIWSRRANVRTDGRHPDSGQPHPIIYNNLAMRQHRNVTAPELRRATNIGFFGDSQTENVRLAAQYSFTEPLDYLLNLSGKSVNVLNFGVDAYGTDQCYLYYQHSAEARHLGYVFYVLSSNDLRNIYENHLFRLQQDVLQQTAPPQPPWWVRLVSRSHLTYLVLDARARLKTRDDASVRWSIEQRYAERWLAQRHLERLHSPRADAIDRELAEQREGQDLRESIDIFRAILKQWRQRVEANGARFYVVILPRPTEALFTRIIGADFNVIDLYTRFGEVFDGYDYDRHVKFKKDGHWNETGNLLAAIEFYRVLERDLDLPPIPDDRLKAALYTYYAAFPGGWAPPRQWVTEVALSPRALAAIRQKYIALELGSD